jgi:hypothetical protein
MAVSALHPQASVPKVRDHSFIGNRRNQSRVTRGSIDGSQIEQLGPKEKRQVLQFIDRMIEREQFKKKANG